MRQILGILLILAGVLLGGFVAFYVCLYGGLVQIGMALKMADPSVPQIAFGVVRIACMGISGMLTFWFCAVLGGWLFSTEPRRTRLSCFDRGW